MNEHHVLGLSGGRDSAALAVFMRERHPELEIKYFFTDTGQELPEVYEYLGRLEGILGRPIHYLNPDRDFMFWLDQYGYFLPSPNTRWCTRQLKLAPFQSWIKPWLRAGDIAHSYVAIRSDEDHREGMTPTHANLKIRLPFREHRIDKPRVIDLLESSGLGLPKYYEWRSRSGCTFCFFQQKIEWVNLRERYPEAFEHAKSLEKSAIDHGSPFTWVQGEPLSELELPERIAQIKADYEARRLRDRKRRVENPLRLFSKGAIQEISASYASPELELRGHGVDYADADDLYLDEEGGGACLVCHK
jgi:hypothetical protein